MWSFVTNLFHLTLCFQESSAWYHTHFIFMANKYYFARIYHILFVDSSVNQHLAYFFLWNIINSVMNICVEVFVRYIWFFSLGYIPRKEIARANGNSLFRKCQIVFLSDLTAPFYITTSNVWGFHFHHILINSCYDLTFRITPLLLSVKWYLIVILLFISVTNDIVHLSMCLLAISISSLQKCLFKSFSHWILKYLFIIEL